MNSIAFIRVLLVFLFLTNTATTTISVGPTEVNVTIPANGLDLVGTLRLPAFNGTRVLGVVLVHGSGEHSQDGPHDGVMGVNFGFEIRVYAEIADALQKHGIAVLTYDKRTCGPSNYCPNNNYPPPDYTSLTVDAFYEDAMAAAIFLQGQPEVRADGITVMGHSQAGPFIPVMLESHPELRSGVILAGAYSSYEEIIEFQLNFLIDYYMKFGYTRSEALEQPSVASLVQFVEYLKKLRSGKNETFESFGQLFGPAFFTSHFDLGVQSRAALFSQPILILNGQFDFNVPATEALAWSEHFRQTGATYDLFIPPCITHVFNCVTQPDITKITSADIGKHVDVDVLETLVRFVLGPPKIEVAIPSTNGQVLAGTLRLPSISGDETCVLPPGVVIVHGSGEQSRDGLYEGQLGVGFGFKIPVYAQIAHALQLRGIPVLTYDKRICGKYNGCSFNNYIQPNMNEITIDTFIQDALAAVEFLKRRPEVKSDGIIVIGYGQSGQFVPLMLKYNPEIIKGVILAGPYRAIDKMIAYQRDFLVDYYKQLGHTEDGALALPGVATLDDAVKALEDIRMGSQQSLGGFGAAFWRSWMDLHERSLEAAYNVSQPIFILNGDLDWNNPSSEAQAWGEYLRGTGVTNNVLILPCITHALNCLKESDPTQITPSDIGSTVHASVTDSLVEFVDLPSACSTPLQKEDSSSSSLRGISTTGIALMLISILAVF